MLLEYSFGIAIDVKTIFQLGDLFIKCKPVVTNNKSLLIKHLIRPVFKIQGQTA